MVDTTPLLPDDTASLPGWMQSVAGLFPLKWLCQGLRSVFLPASFGTQEPGGSFDLPTVALVLGAWCVLALVLCLTTMSFGKLDLWFLLVGTTQFDLEHTKVLPTRMTPEARATIIRAASLEGDPNASATS